MSLQTISAAGLADRYQSGQACDLIDVRTPTEYREVHVEFAKNVPLDQLDSEAVARIRNGNSNEPLYIICHKGGRSKQACEAFLKKGFTNVVNVEGGTAACELTSLPLVRGKKAISLERQVRLAAGSLVLLGVILGFTVHQGFFGLSGFVGAGLVFAGVTDTCGMGILLSKMPWNQ